MSPAMKGEQERERGEKETLTVSQPPIRDQFLKRNRITQGLSASALPFMSNTYSC